MSSTTTPTKHASHLTEAEREELATSTNQADRRKYQNRASQRKHRQGVKQEREERQRQGAQQQQQQDQQPKQAQKQRDAEYIFGRMMVFDDDPLFPLRPPFNSAPPFSFAFLADCPAWQDEDHEDLSAVEGISSASSSSGGGEKGSCAGSATTEREREIEPGRSYDITEFFKLDEFGETLSGGEVEERAQKPEWQSVSP